MCYLVRRAQPEAERGTTLPPSLDRLRARWIGAAAVTFIGGLAVAAALVTAPSAPPLQSSVKDAAPAPLQSRTTAVPATAGVVEQTSGLIDDGVPTKSDVAKAGLGHCEHGL